MYIYQMKKKKKRVRNNITNNRRRWGPRRVAPECVCARGSHRLRSNRLTKHVPGIIIIIISYRMLADGHDIIRTAEELF